MSDVLEEAREVMYGPRQDRYGDAVQTCGEIGRVWGALLGIGDIPAHRVALMLAGMKLVRESGGRPHRDNLVDAAGYVKIAEDAIEAGEVADQGVVREIERFYVAGEEVAAVKEWGHAETGAEWSPDDRFSVRCRVHENMFVARPWHRAGEAYVYTYRLTGVVLTSEQRVALGRYLLTGKVSP